MATYIGLVHKDEGTSYGVSFPDFPGCISAGDTLDEALRSASEALGFHIRGIQRDGDAIPEPRPLDAIVGTEDAEGAVAVLVTPDMTPKGKAVRVNITIDEYLLAQIDQFAASQGKNRSAFLAEAAREAMQA